MYCLEGCDHPGVDIRDLAIPAGARIEVEHAPELLGGVTMLRAKGAVVKGAGREAPLYRARRRRGAGVALREIGLTAVPYCVWANREPGGMAVWIRELVGSGGLG